ncbi:MAG: HAD family phosphatase [Lysobacter sp.]|nr:MAG: HAD family phosphatase [Lysobacter sp.]
MTERAIKTASAQLFAPIPFDPIPFVPIPFIPQAILFDMDGLMIDSERAILQCWRESAEALSLSVDDALWMRMTGLHDADCDALLRQRMSAHDAQALRTECDRRYERRVADGLPLMPGVFDVLDDIVARGLPRAVVTSTRRERADRKLAACGLARYFEWTITGSDVAAPKPSPEGYAQAAHRLGVRPERCVVFEDSSYGVRAALAAGMTPIQVPDLVPPDAETRALGHRIVASLREAYALVPVDAERSLLADRSR